jgi:Protein of unknown function (DUF1499)
MTGLLPRLLGLLYPACAAPGAAGLPPPRVLDLSRLARPRPRNSALAAPPGLHLLPDIVTRRREVPPRRLYEALVRVALAQPRTVLHAEFRDQLQAHFVARSARCNFPDLVAVQVTPESLPALYSRAVYGRLDFGVNRRRLVAWLAALDAALEGS